jgi:hypothetical protein
MRHNLNLPLSLFLVTIVLLGGIPFTTASAEAATSAGRPFASHGVAQPVLASG